MDVIHEGYSEHLSHTLNERFQIICSIGKGRNGSVYKAKDLSSGKVTALKIIHSEQFTKRSQDEIDSLMRIKSNNVVQYLDHHSDEFSMWISMEYCLHGSLWDIMNEHNMTFSEIQVSGIMHHVLSGLYEMHRNSMIHRDLKGSNILLSAEACIISTNEKGDLGATAQLSSTVRRRFTYTPSWMAPECLVENAYTSSVDIWSLGITVIELLSGRPPLYEEPEIMVMYKVPRNPSPSIPESHKYSKNLNDFVSRCLNKDETNRPSAKELLAHPFIVDNLEEGELALKHLCQQFSLTPVQEVTRPADLQMIFQSVLELGGDGLLDILESDDVLISQFMKSLSNRSTSRRTAIHALLNHARSREIIVDAICKNEDILSEIDSQRQVI